MPGQVNPAVNSSNVWDVVSRESGIDRNVCKKVVYGLLFGQDVISVMCHHSLELCNVTDIRMSFDKYTTTWKTGR